MSVHFNKENKKWYFVVRIDGKQYKRYTTHDNKTVAGTGTKFDKARKVIEAEEALFIAKMTGSPQMTIDDFFERYLKSLNVKESTKNAKRSIFKNRLKPFLGGKKLIDITAKELDEVFNIKMKDKSLAWKRNAYEQITALYHYANKLYDVPEVIKRVDRPKYKTIKDSYTFWTHEDFMRAMSIMFKSKKESYIYYRTLFLLLYLTGLRIGEALALTIDSFVFRKDGVVCLNVDSTWSHRKKEIIKSTKNNKNRLVVIPKALAALLLKHIDKNQTERIFDITQRTALIFLRRFSARHNLPDVNLHSFRHAHTSMLIQSGANVVESAYRLGHSVQVMLSIYTQYDKNFKNMEERVNSFVDFSELNVTNLLPKIPQTLENKGVRNKNNVE